MKVNYFLFYIRLLNGDLILDMLDVSIIFAYLKFGFALYFIRSHIIFKR